MVEHVKGGTITIVSRDQIEQVATRALAYDAVKSALIAAANTESLLFPVSIGCGQDPNSMVAVKAGFDAETNIVGAKVGTYWPDNAKHGLPNHGSTTLLLDPETGMPTALVNAIALNGLRTAAANAVATDHLARKDAKTLLIVGAGHQARCEALALADVRTLTHIKIWNRHAAKAVALAEDLQQCCDANVTVEIDLEAAVRKIDIIATVTPSQSTIIKADWVQPGTHISAMGADRKGKQELDPVLMAKAALFADAPKQSREIGEFQHAIEQGLISPEMIVPIGSLLEGSHSGRENVGQITIFDSSGIALQDIAIAAKIVEHLTQSNTLKRVAF